MKTSVGVTIKAEIGDYVIKKYDGEFSICKPDVFKKTYEDIE